MMSLILILACGSSKDTEYESSAPTSEIVDTNSTPENSCGWEQVSSNADPLLLEGDLSCGTEVYLSKCAICHLENGEGSNAGKKLAGFIDQYSDAHIVEVIQDGWGPMPPVDINHQQIADVLLFLRETF